MAFVVEYTFLRPNTEVEWPSFGAERDARIEALREAHSISSHDSISDDGLTWKRIQSAASTEEYTAFYEKGQPIWEEAKIMDTAADRSIQVDMVITENT